MFTFGYWRVVFCWTLFRKATRLSADGLPLVRPFTSCVPSGFVMARCAALSVSGVKERRNRVIVGRFAAGFYQGASCDNERIRSLRQLVREAIAPGGTSA